MIDSTLDLIVICITALLFVVIYGVIEIAKKTASEDHDCPGGPPGPVGPQGVQGPPGPGCEGSCCRDVETDKNEEGPTRRSPWPGAV